jgi:hypothetical protein
MLFVVSCWLLYFGKIMMNGIRVLDEIMAGLSLVRGGSCIINLRIINLLVWAWFSIVFNTCPRNHLWCSQSNHRRRIELHIRYRYEHNIWAISVICAIYIYLCWDISRLLLGHLSSLAKSCSMCIPGLVRTGVEFTIYMGTMEIQWGYDCDIMLIWWRYNQW